MVHDRDAQAACGVIGRLVPSIDREADAAAALEMVGWVIAHRAEEVVGIGMDYRENDRPPELFAQAYAAARQAGPDHPGVRVQQALSSPATACAWPTT